ncbi:uncharacterized protein LOC129942831 [Eupeodes corollae]|uniref:uncharacterized protein LOC129942831 n=1 Tax=Eupeodes corollae TaxID=290404 RepID=UPI00249161E9|nr:uncharacterized protein LOC129942831 [Eupeodes corollae]
MKCSKQTSPVYKVKSSDFGIPQIITTKPKFPKSTSYISTSSDKSPINASLNDPTHVSTSRVLDDTRHRTSVKATRLQFTKLCEDSAVFGAPPSFIGKCPGQEIKQKFKLTEDPRKRFCLRNPQKIHYKPKSQPLELAKIRELVKTAENVVSESHSSNSSICEVIDLANPFGLDFQGTDFKNTYERDEQTCQNDLEYQKVKRFHRRRNVQFETAQIIEIEQKLERSAIPKRFIVSSSSVKAKPKLRLSKLMGEKKQLLVRSEQKPEVLKKLKEEDERRKERYKQLHFKKKSKTAKKHEEEVQAEKIATEEKAMLLAKKDFDDFLTKLDGNVVPKVIDSSMFSHKKGYPHNISEARKFKHDMKKSKRILIEHAKIKEHLLEEMGRYKKIPESRIEISAESSSPSCQSIEQSSNDEDDLVVGKKESKFLLRGYCYRQGPNLRGKFHQNETGAMHRKVKGCITRNEWFESLVLKKTQRKNEKDGDEMTLYPPELGLKEFHTKSAIQEFRQKPLGCHYDRKTFKKLHFKKPKTLKKKKFHLTGFLYGKVSKKKPPKSITDRGNYLKGFTMDFIRTKVDKEKSKKKMEKIRRMRYLGISHPEEKSSKVKSLCAAESNSGSSEWVPDDVTGKKIASKHIDLQARGNMPAPEYREATLRQNPSNSRDYQNLRIPSSLLDEFVRSNHIPVLRKPRKDQKILQNIRSVKDTEFAKKFDARHHHDHWDPTEHKTINVRYSRKIVKPKVLDEQSEVIKKRSKVSGTFDKARPRGSDVDKIDFPMPKLNIDEIIEKHGSKSKDLLRDKQTKVKEIRHSKDLPIHSLAEDEFQEFPGREKFLEFIGEIKSTINKRSEKMVTDELEIDKSTLINELKEDLLSIESCVTSLSSSECTNLSMNSGSFLIAADKKVPMDYFRKPIVPFEEMVRRPIEVVPIDSSKKEMNPYRTVPFAGQHLEQVSISVGKDNFFTFNTRLRNGLRQRLEVESKDRKVKLLGPKEGPKAPAQVATDIDALYIEDLKNRPPLKLFKWNSCRTMLKDALRKKFESMLIQGEIVRTKIIESRNEEYHEQLMKSKPLFEKLFEKWEKREQAAAMEAVRKIRPYYEASDVYRKKFEKLNKQFSVLNIQIICLELEWSRRTILQNFHYLLADLEWRKEHDWIHRNADGSLESFEESIAKRSVVNIRKRIKDDAWAVKEYFDEVFLKNPHPVIIVFKNATEFINGIESLKNKTFVLLRELHYTLWISAELEQKYQELSDWCTIELESKKKYGENKCANKYFMENRATKLKHEMKVLLKDPIKRTFGYKLLCEIKGVSKEMYAAIVPTADQMDLPVLEQVAAISDVLHGLIAKLEDIPVDKRIRVEKKHRRLLEYRRNMSKQAVLVERRIESELVKVQRNMAPVFQKPKRVGNLQRSELKKMVHFKHKEVKQISDETKLFYEGGPKDQTEVRKSLNVIDGMQQSVVPFYFDHFLIINGYQPCYDFKTQIELNDGPEIDRLHVKKLLPEVTDKLEKWQAMQKRIMEENISKNPQMYQNVRV